MGNLLPMSQAQVKSDIQPRKPTLERGRDRGDKGPRTRGTAQEGGLPRESRGCPGRRLGERMGQDQEDQPAPVISLPLCLNRPVPAALSRAGSVFEAAGEVPNQSFCT